MSSISAMSSKTLAAAPWRLCVRCRILSKLWLGITISEGSSMKKNSKRFAIGTLAAVAMGYLIGILTAPKSGRETREDIKDTAVKSMNVAEKELKKLHTQLAELLVQAREQLTKLSGKAKSELEA